MRCKTFLLVRTLLAPNLRPESAKLKSNLYKRQIKIYTHCHDMLHKSDLLPLYATNLSLSVSRLLPLNQLLD